MLVLLHVTCCNLILKYGYVTDSIIVSEGANTMDIGRGLLLNNLPRHRLDAGTFGTMGVGPGFAIAAAFWCKDFAPEKKVFIAF